MTHIGCRHCRVRFSGEATTYLTACPECGRPIGPIEPAQDLLGFRLFDPLDLTDIVNSGFEVSPTQTTPPGARF